MSVTSSELGDLYQEVILEHSKAPRNYRKPASANHHAEGFNPLCGDRCSVYLDVENGAIKDIGFQGSGCAISRASASMMTQVLKGKSTEEAAKLFEEFHNLVTGDPEAMKHAEDLGKLAAFGGVSKFPARVKCATLAWHTLQSALADKQETVSTEYREAFMSASIPTNSNAAPVAGPFQEEMIWKALKTVRDPEIPVDIVNLGLVYAASASEIEGGRRIDVRMSLTAPGCSMSDVIKAEVERKLAALPEVKQVHVEIVFDPPWNASMMSEGAKLQLGFDSDYGAAKPGPASSGPFKVLR